MRLEIPFTNLVMRRILNYIMIAVSALGFAGCGNGGKRVPGKVESPSPQPTRYANQITIDELPSV